ncbi:syntaxin-71-like isoform X1 [Juglans microcarpa x Juglans regia]|uniref:syntaxin-71-like isoform X1 n=1 Tax=Juglans microcarpa x Juglans regia TaxID=2249226 RepID=UPI001B7D9DE4|nr:syntaxin-71-like isoform X1 [Juglans microcarpa x Juglans regia]
MSRTSVVNLITRVDAICKKYEKYDIDKHKDLNVSGDDAFARLYAVIEADAEATFQKSEAAATQKNRATAVAINAEIRRAKARLLEELPKLQRLAFKKVKGLSKEELEARNDLVFALKEKIDAIRDGSTTNGAKQTGGGATSTSYTGIKFNSTSDGRLDYEYFQQTEESDRFKHEYEMRRMQQDQGLDVIAEGLGTLKNMAHDMNEELDRQVPLMDEIDDKVDRANADLKSANVKLKETITQLRSSRNFCIDIILLCIILGIAAYLYNVLK